MVNVGLTFYEIEINELEKNTQKDYELFEKYYGYIVDSLSVYVRLNSFSHNERSSMNYSNISGFINYHELNKTNSITKFPDNNEEEFRPIPYYFSIKFDYNSYKIYLILEKKGNIGIKLKFEEFLNNIIKKESHSNDIKINLIPMTPSKLLKKYITEGNIKSVIYYKNNVKKKLFEGMDTINTDMKIKIKIKENKYKPQEFLNNEKDLLIFEKELYDDISFQVELFGKIRNIYINEYKKFSPYIEITKSIVYDLKGNPTFKSIDNEAKKIAKIHYGIDF